MAVFRKATFESLESLGLRGVSKDKVVRITLADSVTALGSGCFCWWTSLIEVRNTDQILALSEKCFRKCRSLTAFSIPPKVTALPACVFDGCRSLEEVEMH